MRLTVVALVILVGTAALSQRLLLPEAPCVVSQAPAAPAVSPPHAPQPGPAAPFARILNPLTDWSELRERLAQPVAVWSQDDFPATLTALEQFPEAEAKCELRLALSYAELPRHATSSTFRGSCHFSTS